MEPVAVAATLDEIIRSLRHIEYDVGSDDFDWVEYENLVEDLEDLSDALRSAEEERLSAADGGAPASCLWCGSRFRHEVRHACPSLVLRGGEHGERTV